MPWHVEGRGDEFAIVDEMDVEVASVPYTAETGDEPLDTAEGRRAVLLSAAPEMLAVLEALVNVRTDGDYYAVADEARAAIALAKGGAA